MIHPQTGAIYPLESFKFEDTTLNVLAEDQNGNQGCNNATLELDVSFSSNNKVYNYLYI